MAGEERTKKTRVSVTLTGTYLDAIDQLVESGVYLNRSQVFNDALRRVFRLYNIRQFEFLDEAEGLNKVDVLCPICQKSHAKTGFQNIDENGTRHILFAGDPFCSDECRRIASEAEEEVDNAPVLKRGLPALLKLAGHKP